MFQIFTMSELDVAAMKLDRALLKQQQEAMLYFKKEQLRSDVAKRTAKACANLSSRYSSARKTQPHKPSPKPSPDKLSPPRPSELSPEPSTPKQSPKKSSRKLIIEVFDSSDDETDYVHNISVSHQRKHKMPPTLTQLPPQLPRPKPEAMVTLVEYIKQLQREHLH